MAKTIADHQSDEPMVVEMGGLKMLPSRAAISWTSERKKLELRPSGPKPSSKRSSVVQALWPTVVKIVKTKNGIMVKGGRLISFNNLLGIGSIKNHLPLDGNVQAV